MTTTVFQDTPVMQTYLNAFVVSDFDFLSNENTKRPDALLQRVFGQPSIIASGDADFALEAGERIMEAMEGYFRYNYSLPKLDQVNLGMNNKVSVLIICHFQDWHSRFCSRCYGKLGTCDVS